MRDASDGPHRHLEVGGASPVAAVALRWTTRIVVALTIVGLALPGDAGTAIAHGAAGTLIAVPLLRVLWLGGRWFRRGDTRYALAAVALVTVVLLGAVVTSLVA